MTTPMNPTNEELDAAFAEHVAGISPNMVSTVLAAQQQNKDTSLRWPFTRSFDAVLPWLIQNAYKISNLWSIEGFPEKCTVTIDTGVKTVTATGDTIPRTAVIALLRVNGIEVEFTENLKNKITYV